MPTSAAVLRASLEKHNNTFETLLKLIPPQYYIVNEETEAQVRRLSAAHFPVSHPPAFLGSVQVPEAQQETKGPQAGYQGGVEEGQTRKGGLAPEHTLYAPLKFLLTPRASFFQLDPANHKSILDIQNEAYLKQSTSTKGKRKAATPASNTDEDDEGMTMDVDVDMAGLAAADDSGVDSGDDGDDGDDASETEMQPMALSGGIETLRAKLHSKMAKLRRGAERAPNPWAREGDKVSDKDALLDERRRQRAAMRERRRKETREKIRREEEQKMKGRKKDSKEKTDGRDKGNVTKVCPGLSLRQYGILTKPLIFFFKKNFCSVFRRNCLCPTPRTLCSRARRRR